MKARTANENAVRSVRKSHRPSKYDSIVASLGKLQPGKALILTPPEGTTARQLSIRLDSIFRARIRQGLLTLPKGYDFSQIVTEDGDLCIKLVECL